MHYKRLIIKLQPEKVQMDGHKLNSSPNHKRRKLMKNIDSLPDEMLFNILLQLPVQVLYEATRFVCWKWYQIIHTRDFVYEHLKQRSNGLLISAAPMILCPRNTVTPERGRVYPWTYVSMTRQHSIEISTVRCTFANVFWTSCNGLLLQMDLVSRWVHDKFDVAAYYIENPITRRRFYLPEFISPTSHCPTQSGLAYANDYYKVAVTFSKPKDDHFYRRSEEQDCAILTIGVDNSWRHVNTDHLSNTARRVLDSTPLVTQGFLHWYGRDADGGVVVTLNVETETLNEFRVPQGYEERGKEYFSTGTRDLSFVVSENKLLWEAWQMKPDTGEWTRLPKIDLEAKKHLIRTGHGPLRVKPIGWLKDAEVMVFNIRLKDEGMIRDLSSPSGLSRDFIGYDVYTQKIYQFQLDYCMNRSLAHVNSLVNS